MAVKVGIYGLHESNDPSDTEDDLSHRPNKRQRRGREGLIAPFEALADAAALAHSSSNNVASVSPFLEHKDVDPGRLRNDRIPPNAFRVSH